MAGSAQERTTLAPDTRSRSAGPAAPTSDRREGMRADIQALRAFAVLAVVLYHLWAQALPGGYVGVDVFFVISGFLITDHLLRRRDRDGRVRLAAFWSARARRLLPASMTVLLASIALTVLFAPDILQAQYLRSIIASTLYVENWHLAADAVDYLGQENAPPIAQHYWSLSVEEQFYAVWPLFIILATVLAGRARRSERAVLTALLLGLAAVSLAASVWASATTPGLGYFATYSRMWEFALGALVAIIPAWTGAVRLRAVVWLASWAALIVVLFTFGPETLFPGPMALIPTVATAAVIAAGGSGPVVPVADRLLSWSPVQWLGDHSYSIYLWHWPLIIIAPWVIARPLSLPTNIAVLALSLVAAALTKRFIEDPVRFAAQPRRWAPRRVGALTLLAMAVVVICASVPLLASQSSAATRTAQATAELPDPSACRGASAMLVADCAASLDEAIPAEDVIPALSGLYEDTGGAYRCYDQAPSPEPTTCTIGETAADADVRVALVGDSHAAMVIPALEVIAADRGWSVDVFVGRGCAWYSTDPGADCAARHRAIDDRVLSGAYDLLIETWRNTDDASPTDRAEKIEALAARWRTAAANGTRVAALADNPGVPETAAQCLASSAEFSMATCAFAEPTDLLAEDPVRHAADAADASLIDLTRAYCAEGMCPMVAGGVVVYRDTHHITASFSRTLVPTLTERLTAAIQCSE